MNLMSKHGEIGEFQKKALYFMNLENFDDFFCKSFVLFIRYLYILLIIHKNRISHISGQLSFASPV